MIDAISKQAVLEMAYDMSEIDGEHFTEPHMVVDVEDIRKLPHEALLNIKEDPVNPDHYKSQTSLECIEAMEIVFGRGAVIDFCRCNAWKYIWRWKNKNGTEDLEKANWYLERAYEMLDGSDTRMTTVMRMIHYVNKNRGEKEESDG